MQGICFAALVTRIPTLQSRFDLSDGELGLMVGLVPIVAGIGTGGTITGVGQVLKPRLPGLKMVSEMMASLYLPVHSSTG